MMTTTTAPPASSRPPGEGWTDESASPPGTVEMHIPDVVARGFAAASVGLRARVLSRLLPAVGPLALAVLGGGVFAKYAHQARWSALSVTIFDAGRVTSAQVYELASYVQQSDPELAWQTLGVLVNDVTTLTALGATLTAGVLRTLRCGS